MPKRKHSKPPKNYVAYFSICQEIGMRLQEIGRSIERSGVHAPAFHQHIIDDLKSVNRIYEAGTKAILQAQEQWRTE